MAQNKNIVLIMGKPNSGKTTSLRNLNQSTMVYLNTDLKETPFKGNFMANVEVSDAAAVIQDILEVEQTPGVTGVVLDTLTFLMAMYERQYVAPSCWIQARPGCLG